MVWKLTQQQINYGRQHEVILTGYSTQPMSKSKIPVGASMGITSSGNHASTNLNSAWSGFYGAFSGELGSNTEYQRYLQFRGAFLQRFIPTRFRWYWTRDGKGWASRWHSIGWWNASGAGTNLWAAAVSTNNVYDYQVPDSVLLQLDISSPLCGFYFNMEARNNKGNFRGIGEIRGFQTPWPNMAALKDRNGKQYWPLQTIGYKDNKGIVHTAGRLL